MQGGLQAAMAEKDRIICELEDKIRQLSDENRELQETVQWMHDLIWKMLRERQNGPG